MQYGVRPGQTPMDQISAQQKFFKKSWERAEEVNTCCVDLEKAYNH